MPGRWVRLLFFDSSLHFPLKSPHMFYIGCIPAITTKKTRSFDSLSQMTLVPFFGYVYPPTVCAQTPVRLDSTCEWMAPCQLFPAIHIRCLFLLLAHPLSSLSFLRFFYSHPPLLLFSALPLITPPTHIHVHIHAPTPFCSISLTLINIQG